MKTWKLVSGIISIVLFVIVAFQSCAVSFVEALEDSEEGSGGMGLLTSIMLLAGGITSIVTRNNKSNGGNKALIILFMIGAFIGFSSYGGIYGDLIVWAAWCSVCEIMAIISMIKTKRTTERSER